jgi:glycosyltransferase involved in cell wall biosynthesis
MDLSVIIPTSGRRGRLVRTLRSLQAQRLDGTEAEVVVVENGPASVCGELDAEAAHGPLPVRLIQLDTAGTSRARNRALRDCRSEIVLFLGDDTRAATPDLLASHVALHRVSPSERYAVLGRVQWDPDGHVTEFMHWLDRAGFQFSYELLRAGPVSASRYMYTSHTSAKASLLRRHGGFDESFEFLLEDVELGIRLERDGVVLDYHPELVVLHDHPQGLADALQRMERVGRAASLLHRKLPDEAPPEVTAPRAWWALYPPADLIARAALAAGAGGKVRERLWTVRLLAAYARGYRAGDSAGLRLASQDPEAVTPQAEPVENRP